jgi:hypothetical protein
MRSKFQYFNTLKFYCNFKSYIIDSGFNVILEVTIYA